MANDGSLVMEANVFHRAQVFNESQHFHLQGELPKMTEDHIEC